MGCYFTARSLNEPGRVGIMRSRLSGARRPPPSRPDGRRARPPRARPLPLLPALLLGALSLFPASPSHAQDAVTLVSNLTKGTLSTWYSLGTYWASTGFVTGPSTHGFYIESIAAALRIPATLTSEEIAKVRAELWINSDNVSQRPYSKLADLTVPSDLSDGNVSFGVNRVLNANATVHLVVYADGGLGKIGAWVISDTTQHAGAATGWGILDHAYIRSGAWFKYDTPMRIAVTGWARTQLSAPGNVVRTPDDSRITVNWDAVEGADRYRVEYGVANSGSSQKVTVDGATTYTIPNLVNGTPYAIRVQAQNSDEAHVDSPWSPWRQATPAIVPPPGPVVGLSVTPGSTQLALEWTAPSGSPTSYDVHYTSSTLVADGAAAGTAVATQWVAVTGTVTGTSHTITSLQNNTAYRVRVRGVNSAGAGDWAFGTGTPNPTTSGSTDATLSALVLTDHSSNAATLTPAFSSATYAYTAALNAYDGFRVTVTPTVSESNATVRVGMGTSLTEVTSNSASNAIELDYGTNRITVEVTAQAGNKRSYTITVDRALPKVVWPASTNTVSEDVGALTIQLESDGASNDMSGTVSYAAGATHPASLANDIGSGRSTAFTMASGDSHPSTIDLTVVDDALNEEHETFTITIEPGTGYTVGSPSVVTYTIDDNDPPAAPGSFSVNAGVAELTASWSKPAGPVAGYQTRWKETSAPDTLVTTGSDPADGWIVGGAISAASTSQKITDLANGTSYDVQVRADDGQTASGNGYGAWTATQQGAPEKPTMTFIGYTTLVSEGQGTATIYVRLSAALDSATTVSIAVDTISPAQGRAEETADFTLSTKTLNFAAGDTIKTFTASAVADRTTEGEESAYLQLIAVDDAPYALADPFEMELVITDLSGDPGLRIVASDVVTEGALDRMLLNLGNPAPPGGTVVTLSLGTGTATEGTDFTLSSKTDTIPEGQTWVEVRLTALADDVDDNAETVVLNASSTNPEFTADTRTVLIGDTNTPAASAPQNVMVTSGLGTLTVTWEVPAQVSAVTQGSEYQVYVNRRKKGSGDDWPANPTARSTAQRDARSVTLTGLSTVAYEVRVQFRFQSEADPGRKPRRLPEFAEPRHDRGGHAPARHPDGPDGYTGRRKAGPDVGGAFGDGDGLRRALHVGGRADGGRHRDGVGLGRGDGVGGGQPHGHGHRAADHRARERQAPPGAGAGGERGRRGPVGVRLRHTDGAVGVARSVSEPGCRGRGRDGDGHALEGAHQRRGDPARSDGRLGRVGRLRDAGEHHGRGERDHGHGHDPGEPGCGRGRRDVHGGAGHAAVVGEGGDHDLGRGHDHGR